MAAKKTTAPPVEYTSAMDKIRDEMAKSKDKYVEVVGEYLTGFLLAYPEAETALLDKDKSIADSLAAVRKEAEKVKTGNMAILDDRTVFGIVLGYFGLKSEPDVIKKAEDVIKKAEDVPEKAGDVPKKAGDVPKTAGDVPAPEPDPADPFDLDALLGVM